MTVFPVKETMKIRQKAKVIPIFSAVEALGQLDGSVPFIVLLTLSGIAVKFFPALTFASFIVNWFTW